MAEVPSGSIAAAPSPSPPLRHQARPSRRQRSSRMYEKSIVRGRTIMAAPAGESDTTEVTKAKCGSVTFYCDIETKSTTESSWELIARHCFSEYTFETPFTDCKNDCALIIDQLMKDAGTDFEEIKRDLAELRLTCHAEDYLRWKCSSFWRHSAPRDTGSKECLEVNSCNIDQLRGKVNKSCQNKPMPPMYMTQNPVSSGSFTDTTSGMLCADAHSGNWILPVTIGVGVFVGVVVGLTFLCRKFKGLSQRHKQPPGLSQGHQLPPGLSQCHQQPPGLSQGHQQPPGLSQGHQLPPGLSQCHQLPPGLSQCHQQPQSQDQHQEQPRNPEWPRGQDCPVKILAAEAAPRNHGCLAMDSVPFMEMKTQERTVSCGDAGKMRKETLINMIAWQTILGLWK